MDRLNIEEGSGSNNKKLLDIITLRDPQQRGCQLSVTFSIPLEHIHQRIEKMGVLVISAILLQFKCFVST